MSDITVGKIKHLAHRTYECDDQIIFCFTGRELYAAENLVREDERKRVREKIKKDCRRHLIGSDGHLTPYYPEEDVLKALEEL